MTSHTADVQQATTEGRTPEATRDDVLRAAGVRMPLRPVTERQRFIAPAPVVARRLIRIF